MRPSDLSSTYKKLLIPFSFLLMLLVAYMVNPLSFQEIWKGRAFYLFFLWLFALEFILGDNSHDTKEADRSTDWARAAVGVMVLLIPVLYLMETQMFGLNYSVMNFGKFIGVGAGQRASDIGWLTTDSFPYSSEYLIVATSLTLGTYLLLGFKGLKQFSVSIFLLAATGAFYMVDTFMPYGQATSLQGLVPLTATSVAYVLQQTGHVVQMVVLEQGGAVQMSVVGAPTFFSIYWPCAGIQSLFIYTFVILLFLKSSTMSLTAKVITLAIGAVGTFFVNVLRIVSIIDLSITQGMDVAQAFHLYYGEIYFLVYIVIFLFALVMVQRLLVRRKQSKSVA